jgi:hypothetical protein
VARGVNANLVFPGLLKITTPYSFAPFRALFGSELPQRVLIGLGLPHRAIEPLRFYDAPLLAAIAGRLARSCPFSWFSPSLGGMAGDSGVTAR